MAKELPTSKPAFMPDVKSNRVDRMVRAVSRIVKWVLTKVHGICAKHWYKISRVKAEFGQGTFVSCSEGGYHWRQESPC